jgi:hypothetical protein
VRFPDDLPNDGEYLVRRIVGFFGLSAVVFGDLSRFGADPVTQMQRSDLWLQAIEVQSQRLHDNHTEWIRSPLWAETKKYDGLLDGRSAITIGENL